MPSMDNLEQITKMETSNVNNIGDRTIGYCSSNITVHFRNIVTKFIGYIFICTDCHSSNRSNGTHLTYPF